MRTEYKKADALVQQGENLDEAIAQTREAVSLLDKAAGKGIIHKNQAARKKSRLMKRLAELEAQKS
jgi:small subunit ribosomal protein S20